MEEPRGRSQTEKASLFNIQQESPSSLPLMILSAKKFPIGPEAAWAQATKRENPLSFKLLTFESHCDVYSAIIAGSVCLFGGIRVNTIPCGASGNKKPTVEATALPALTKQMSREAQVDEEEEARW